MIEWLRIQIESWIEYRRVERKRRTTCESCEVLKQQLITVNEQNRILLNKLTEKPEIIQTVAPEITRPHAIPWSVKRQELQKADRELAEKLKREKLAEITPTTELEKEVLTAELKTEVK